MPKIRDIEYEIGKIGSIEDYHNVQGKLAELKDEHEKNKSTSIWYMMEGADIEDLEKLLDDKYRQLSKSKKDEEIIVEVKDDKEESSFLESEVNPKENYEKGLDTWITEMENKIEKAQTLEELKKLRLEALEKEEEGKKYGVERENLKRVRKIYSKCRNKSKEIEKTENTKVAEKSAQKPADSMYDQFLDSAR